VGHDQGCKTLYGAGGKVTIPSHPPGLRLMEVSSVREVSRQAVQELMARGAQVVDVLPAEEYQEDHLPGAIHLPLRRIETEARTVLDPSRPVVVYCWDSA
jgi:rhodanese-related sulfurtransferase